MLGPVGLQQSCVLDSGLVAKLGFRQAGLWVGGGGAGHVKAQLSCMRWIRDWCWVLQDSTTAVCWLGRSDSEAAACHARLWTSSKAVGLVGPCFIFLPMDSVFPVPFVKEDMFSPRCIFGTFLSIR